MHAETWWGKLRERHYFENTDGSITAKWVFKKYCGRRGVDGYGSECGQLAGFFEHGNEPSGSIKWRERGISSLVAELRASQDKLCSTGLVLHRVVLVSGTYVNVTLVTTIRKVSLPCYRFYKTYKDQQHYVDLVHKMSVKSRLKAGLYSCG
jgi:hypothetical protein